MFANSAAFAAIEERTSIRVGISTNSFASYEHNKAIFVLSGNSVITDMSNEINKLNVQTNKDIEITLQGEYFNVSIDNKNIFKESKGPIVITSNNKIGIRGINRKGDPAYYRGIIELMPVSYNKFNIVNILDMQSYLKGVVPNEMPVSFGFEALKAQAVAARNYANRPSAYKNYDVCDSVACQVYYGANGETPLSNKAVDETLGVYALYRNDIILALYSSTASGITENYLDTFGNGIEDKPYMRSVADNKDYQNLKNENEIAKYFKENVPSFDVKSPKYRWQKKFDRFELESILTKTLKEQSRIGAVTPAFDINKQLYGLEDIEIIRRGSSYKALDIKIKSAAGDYIIKKELPIRRIFKDNGQILPSANFVIEKEFDKYDKYEDVKEETKEEKSASDNFIVGRKLNEPKKVYKSKSGRRLPSTFVFYGAGFGHGVGMSQYGAGYLSSYGVGFEGILKHYYKGITVGTMPKEVKYNDINVNYTQDFYYSRNKAHKNSSTAKSPLQKEINELINLEKDERCYLIIENPDDISRVEFFINDYYFDPTIQGFNKRFLKTDVTRYIINGKNRVEFRPLNNNNKKKTVRFYIIFGEKNE